VENESGSSPAVIDLAVVRGQLDEALACIGAGSVKARFTTSAAK